MKKIKLLVVTQIILVLSLLLTWINVSYFISNRLSNNYMYLFAIYIDQFFLASLLLIIYYFRKLGTNNTKRVGTIAGYMLLLFFFMFDGLTVLGNIFFKSALEFYERFGLYIKIDILGILYNILLSFQITFTVLLVLLDLLFLFCYIKTIKNCSFDDYKKYMNTYKAMSLNKQFKRIHWSLFISILLITTYGLLVIFFSSGTIFAIFLIIMLVVSNAFLSSKGINYRFLFKTAKNKNFYSKLQILFAVSVITSILFNVLMNTLNNLTFAILNIFTSLIYSIPTIILFEQMNCYYINLYETKINSNTDVSNTSDIKKENIVN